MPAPRYASIADQLKDPSTQLLLAQVLRGEAGGNVDDMRDVLGTVINRARMGNQSIHDVLLSEGQFTSIGNQPGSSRGDLERMGPDQLGAQYAEINKVIPDFDPETGQLKDFDPLVSSFYAPVAQSQYADKYPGIYSRVPKWAVGKKPIYSAGGQEFFEGPYSAKGMKVMSGLTNPNQPTGSSVVNQAIGMQPVDMSMFQPSPAQQKQIDADTAAAQGLMPQVLKNIDAMGPVYDEEIKGLQGWQDRANQAWDSYQANMKKVTDSLPDERKLEMEELQKVSPQHPGDKMRALGEFLPMLVMFAGLGKGDAIGAMDAATASLNAAKANDDQALDRAHQEFTDQLAEAVDKGNMFHQMMAEGIAQAGGNQKELMQKADLIATKMNAPALKQAALLGDAKTVYDFFALQSKGLAEAIAWQRASSASALNSLKMQQIEQTLEGGGTLSQPDLAYAAETYRLTRSLPPLGYGQAAVAARQKIIDEADRLARGLETDPDAIASAQAARGDVGGQYDIKSIAGSLNQLQRLKGQVAQNEGTAEATANRILELAPSAALGGPPVINKWFQAGRKQILGDKAVNEFNDSIATFIGEYAAVMSGSSGTGGRGTTDQARNEAKALIDNSMTPDSLLGVINNMKFLMQARMQTLDGVIQMQQGLMPGYGEQAQTDPGYIPGVDQPQQPQPTTGGGGAVDAGGPTVVTPDNMQQFRQEIIKGRERVQSTDPKLHWSVDEFKRRLKEGWQVNDKQVDDAVQGLK